MWILHFLNGKLDGTYEKALKSLFKQQSTPDGIQAIAETVAPEVIDALLKTEAKIVEIGEYKPKDDKNKDVIVHRCSYRSASGQFMATSSEWFGLVKNVLADEFQLDIESPFEMARWIQIWRKIKNSHFVFNVKLNIEDPETQALILQVLHAFRELPLSNSYEWRHDEYQMKTLSQQVEFDKLREIEILLKPAALSLFAQVSGKSGKDFRYEFGETRNDGWTVANFVKSPTEHECGHLVNSRIEDENGNPEQV